MIKICAADKLQLNRGPDDLALVEVKSNGERTIFKDNDLSIPTALTLNGRLFISPRDHLDALTPLPEQEGATEGLEMDLEALPTKDLAYHMTLFDWDLFWAVHEYELLYHTFGRHHFNKVRQPSLGRAKTSVWATFHKMKKKSGDGRNDGKIKDLSARHVGSRLCLNKSDE